MLLGMLLTVLFVVGLLMYIYGVAGLLRALASWVGRMLRLFLCVAVLFIPAQVEASAEVRITCHERTMYQAFFNHTSTWPGARIWSIKLCADFEHIEHDDGATETKPLPPATISWTPYGLYKTMWNADQCDAWISPATEAGTYQVRGRCTIRFAFAPFLGAVKGDIVQRDVWVGFTQGYIYTDYWYSSRVDFLNETSDPLPYHPVCDDRICAI